MLPAVPPCTQQAAARHSTGSCGAYLLPGEATATGRGPLGPENLLRPPGRKCSYPMPAHKPPLHAVQAKCLKVQPRGEACMMQTVDSALDAIAGPERQCFTVVDQHGDLLVEVIPHMLHSLRTAPAICNIQLQRPAGSGEKE